MTKPLSRAIFTGVIPRLAVPAAAFTFVIALVCPFAVSTLPRPMPGESVAVPLWICVAGHFAAAILAPSIVGAIAIRSWRGRTAFLLMLTAGALFWYFVAGFDELLSKAWRRGL